MVRQPRTWASSVQGVDRQVRRLVDALKIILDLDRRLFETSSSLDKLLEEILKGTRKLTGAKFAQILLRKGQELVVAHSTDPAHCGQTFAIESCASGIAVETGKRVMSGDVYRDFGARYKAMFGGEKRKMRSEIVIPIKSPPPHSVIVGVLNVESPKADAFDHADADMVEQFARQAGAAMHSARFGEALQLTLDLAKSIRVASPDAVRGMLTKLAGFFNHKVEVQFLLHERNTSSLVIECSTVPSTEKVRVLAENSFSGYVVSVREPRLSNDVRKEYPAFFQDTVGGTQSELAAPVFDGEQNVVGVLNVESSVKDAFTHHDLYLLSIVAEAGVWQRIQELRRTSAIASMLAIGEVASHAVHVLNNYMRPIDRQCQKVLAAAPPGEISKEFTHELAALRVLLGDVWNSLRSIDIKYENALQGNVATDVNRLVEEKRPMVGHGVTFDLDLDGDIPELQLPPSIADVFWNLISNANQAIPVGGPGRIIVRTKLIKGAFTQQPESLEIDVIDDGVGMAPEKLARLFKLGSGDRHGYGLWWVKAFVDRCQGTITVKSESGRGTHFHLSFPLTADGAARSMTMHEVNNAGWVA